MGCVSWQKWLVSSGFCWPHLLNVHVQSMDFAATSTDDADQISAGKHEYSQDPHSVALIDFRFWDLLMDDFWSSIFWWVMQKIRSQEDSSSQLKNADDQIILYQHRPQIAKSNFCVINVKKKCPPNHSTLQWHPAMAPSNVHRPLPQSWSSPSPQTIAHYNGTLQWHHVHSPKVGRHPPPPTIAHYNGTPHWHP